MNNFVRQSYYGLGAASGVLMTGLFGWPAAVGWLIGGVGGAWLLWALVCGYIRVGRPAPLDQCNGGRE